MSELTFDADQLKAVVEELVPSHQRDHVLAALALEDPTQADFDRCGTALTGEQVNTSFLLWTAARGIKRDSLWAAIKDETYDLLCTTSKKYSTERGKAESTIRDTVMIIATAVAATFNLALGVVVGAVTVAVMCALKVGRNAWCEVNKPTAQVR